MHKYGVVIGRFQPLHNGHVALLRAALEQAKNLIVLVGSHQSALTIKNPFSAITRINMMQTVFNERELERMTFRPVHDHLYRERDWVSEVRQIVESETGDSDDIALIGHNKDHTSYYLELFPDWKSVDMPIHNDGVSATDVRAAIFDANLVLAESLVPGGTWHHIVKWIASDAFVHMAKEYEYIRKYREAWSASPYPPTLVTVDAVVTCSDYVLLVRRGGYPGHGLLALPGGFIEQHETIYDAARRELREETGKTADLQFVRSHVFDHPGRSLLGRVITHAHHFETNHLHDIKAADDAASARWYPRHKLKAHRAEFHDDHFHILEHFLGA